MAIYHLEAKVVSRGTGRSAVTASAYLSCSKILNDYDGVLHDYTRKKGLVWQEVFLPEFAPSEWKERGVLWNAVEENEKTKDSRLRTLHIRKWRVRGRVFNKLRYSHSWLCLFLFLCTLLF